MMFAAMTMVIFLGITGCKTDRKIPIKVLLLPKFEIGEMSGDAVGEAQLFYEAYLQGADQW